MTVEANWMVSNMGDPNQRKAHSITGVGAHRRGRCGYSPTKITKLSPAPAGVPHCPRCEERLRFARLQGEVANGVLADFDMAGEATAREASGQADHILAVEAENIRLKEELTQLRASVYTLYDAAVRTWRAYIKYGPVEAGGMTEAAGAEFEDALLELKVSANVVKKYHNLTDPRKENPQPVGGPAGGG